MSGLIFWTVTVPSLLSMGFYAGLRWVDFRRSVIERNRIARHRRSARVPCSLVIYGDTTVCESCATTWRNDEGSPPICPRANRFGRTAA